MASALKRPEPKPTYSELGFDDDLIRKLKEFNKADFDFYHRMNQTFWETVRVSKIFSEPCSPNKSFRIRIFRKLANTKFCQLHQPSWNLPRDFKINVLIIG